MIVQREVHDDNLGKLLQTLDETELTRILAPYLKKKQETSLVKIGKHIPFKPFKAIKMKGEGLSASEMVVHDRL